MKGLILFLSLSGVCVALPTVTKTPASALKVGAPPSGTACSNVHLRKCQADFNQVLGISGNLDWTTPIDFNYAIQNVYQMQQQKGLVQVCSAYTGFANCLGPSYAACTNIITFIRDEGLDPVMAGFYPAVIAQLHFQCGGGLETLIANWQCITSQEVVVNKTLQACQFAYTLNITNDLNHACQYGNDLMACMRQPFQGACGAASSWFMCENTRAGLATHLPYCPLRCNVYPQITQENSEFQKKAIGMSREEGFEEAKKSIENSPHMQLLNGIAAHAEAEQKAHEAQAKPE